MAADDLVTAILDCVCRGDLQDASSHKGIGTADVARLADEFDRKGWMVEQAALENDVLPQRYSRNLNTFSREDQIRLLGSTAAVVGLGGLGGGLVETLVRGGVGTLRLMDGDRFEESNLNRQLFSTPAGIGTSKAEAARDRIRRINPSISVTVYDTFLDKQNAARLIQGADVVVDCLDSLGARFVLETAATSLGIPMVSAAVAGETGHVTTVYPGDTGLAAIHGQPEKAGDKGVERSLGSPPHSVSVLSALESAEVFKVLLGREGILRNRLLIVDLSDYTVQTIQLS
jgi:molybdopterin/thiamine biosynthesis adenylyltransferase